MFTGKGGMRRETQTHYQEIIGRVIEHIHCHLSEELTLGRLSRVACLSPYHFHRVFQGMLGQTISDYVRQARLQQAAQQLIGSETPISRIALEAGYESHESFSRAFKTMTGVSPSVYRNNPFAIAALSIQPLQETGGIKMDVRIEQCPDRLVAFVRHTGAYYKIGSAFEKLGQWAQTKEELKGPHAEMLGIYYDDPEAVSEEELRSAACVTLPGEIAVEPPVEIGPLKGGEYAVATYVGPYSGLGDAWMRAFTEALPKTGRQPAPMNDPEAGPCFEKYVSDMSVTPEEELITEIWIPLAPAY